MGQQSQPPDERPRLKTARETYLWDFPTREGTIIDAIPTGMIVVPDFIFEPVKVANVTYRRISLPAAISLGKPLEGWMQEGDLKKVLSEAEEQEQRLRERKDLPPLCRLANREYLDKAWTDILDLCDENEKLGKEQRPEPYFARAELYTKFENNVFAMQDYLKGLRCIKNMYTSDNEMSYLLYEKYFRRIDEASKNLFAQPFSVTDLGRNERETICRHFSLGYSLFWEGERESNCAKRHDCYKRAAMYFDNAIAVDWQCPASWYYRGLAHWRLGDKESAAFNFLFASNMEKELNLYSEISEYLARFQGNDRMFLERIRWGEPVGHDYKGVFEIGFRD